MPSRDPLVYILILNWNGWQDTIECLESVFNTDYSNYRVIVCDNGSNDQSLPIIKRWADSQISINQPNNSPIRYHFSQKINRPIKYKEYTREAAEQGGDKADCATQLVLIQNGANLGFAGGNNVGLRYAISRGDYAYVWVLNNDTVLKSDALMFLVRRMQELPNAGICGSTVLYYRDPSKVQAFGGATFNKSNGTTKLIGHFWDSDAVVNSDYVEGKMDFVLGASMLVSASFLSTIGLFSEDYFLFYEEVDWALRGKEIYQFAYAPGSVVYHKEGSSVGSGSWSKDQSLKLTYYNTRNRLKIINKFYPNALPKVYLSLFYSMLGRIYRCQWQNALIIFMNILGIEKLNKKIYGF